MTRGVVIGKFYPPHLGHSYLIDTALGQVDQLKVIVCYRQDESIPGQLRAEWLRHMHPSADVMLVEDKNYPGNDSKFWAQKTIEWLGFVPDVAFTSERYGQPWTEFMGCQHVLVDLERQKFPVCGTKVRQDPFAMWNYLAPPVRGYFAKRIVIIGAESTGTTTLAHDLAEHYQTCWVPEYGRFYYEGKMTSTRAAIWSTDEFIHIAQMQNQMEDALAEQSNKILIADTNSLATAVWHQRYVGQWSERVAAVANDRKVDGYILTNTDIPFVQDGTRDGEHIRQWMHDRFMEVLKTQPAPFIVVSGSRRRRVADAAAFISRIDQKSKRATFGSNHRLNASLRWRPTYRPGS